MTEIKHHLTDALLMGYSAGTLPEAFNLVVATHISLCDECRARMYEFDSVGGEILEEETIASMSENSLNQTLDMIEASDIAQLAASAFAPSSPNTDTIFPTPCLLYTSPSPRD